MATEIIKDIDTYDSNYLFKIGIFFCFFFIILVVLFKNLNNNNSIPFVATFNYVEGINDNTEVKLAGIKVGDVNQIVISQNEQELQDVKIEIEKSIDEQTYIIFELPNYKLRVGNFLNRKEAESFQKKIVRLGYRTAWVVPTMIEKED